MFITMFILAIIIGVMCITSRLILRYKFKIPKPQYIDVNTLQPKYLKHILIGLLIFAILITMHIPTNNHSIVLWLCINNIINCIYRIKYLKNDKSRYYIIIEFVFWVYGCISVIASFFW